MQLVLIVMSLFLTLLQVWPPPRLASHELVERVGDHYGRLDSLSVDFEQVLTGTGRPLEAKGHLDAKSRGRARFEYFTSTRRFDYFDGKRQIRYHPEQRQAFSEPMTKSTDERLLIFLFLGNRNFSWKDEFEKITEGGPSPNGNRVMTLVPRRKENIPEIVVEINPNTLFIERFEFSQPRGGRTIYRFANFKVARLDDSLFQFNAPRDVDVFVK
jgi:outer membrane lipoprotein-sorting protein